MREGATLRKQPQEEPEFIWGEDGPRTSISRHWTFEFSSNDFEVITHDKPTENLQKLLDLGYKEGQACRILDTLDLD